MVVRDQVPAFRGLGQKAWKKGQQALNLPSVIGQMRLACDATGRKWFNHGESGVTGCASGIEYIVGKLEAIYAPGGRMVAEYTGG